MYCNVEYLYDSLYISEFNNNNIEYSINKDFKPCFFINDNYGKYKLFKYENKLSKVCSNLINYYDDKKQYNEVYNHISPKYQFISQKYYNEKRNENYNIRIHHLDIETYSTKEELNPKEAEDSIILIQIFESDTKTIYVFGTKDIKDINKINSSFNKIYFKFNNEIELLKGFVNFVKERNPLITDAWYGNLFDFPYLINRCIKLNVDYLDISPFRKFKKKIVNVFGENITILLPIGRYWIDSQELYEYFSSNKDSFKLNDVGEVELNLLKIDYSTIANSLNELYDNHYVKFVEYGIRDVEILYYLNKKLNFIDIMINQAWDMGVNFDDIFSIVKCWTYKVYNDLIKENIILPNIQNIENKENYLGGFILSPKSGKYEMVLGFDVRSEYPNSIRANNISNETIVEYNELKNMKNSKFLLKLQNNLKSKGKEEYLFSLDNNELKEIVNILREENIILSSSGDYFYLNKDGFLPKVITKIFDEREIAIQKVNEYNRIVELCKKIKLEKGIQ